MDRYVNGVRYAVKEIDGEYDVSVHDLGGGHKEVSIRQVRAYVAQDDYVVWSEASESFAERSEEEEARRRDDNAKRAARRAKSKVRRLVKVMACDALLTLTYRANMTDRETVAAHLKAFVRRVRAVLPSFAYVAAFEQQKRGAWHVHLATHALPRDLPWSGAKVKSYSVIRAIWRRVVGELGGNIDQQRRKRASRQSCGKLASYLSKYMLKAYEDGDKWENRFSSSRCTIPDAVRQRLKGQELRDLIAWAYSMAGPGDLIAPWLNSFRDGFFLSIEPGLKADPPPA